MSEHSAVPLSVALIGRGMAATVFHAPLIRAVPYLRLATMCGTVGTPDVLADDSIDLVVIATPNDTHADLAEAALRAGKHVVIDKPFTVTSGEADHLIGLAATQQRMLTVFHNRRWDGDFLTVRRLFNENVLGDISLFEAAWDRFRPNIKTGWRETARPGTGLLWDLGSHLIDQVLVLLGRPDSVSADIAQQRADAKVDDYFMLTFGYGQRRVVLAASTLINTPRPRFAIHGDAASFVKFGLDPQEDVLKAGGDPTASDHGKDAPSLHGNLAGAEVVTETGRYLSFYEHVADAIRKGVAAPVDPRDARDVVFLIEQAKKSAGLGIRVDLDWECPPT